MKIVANTYLVYEGKTDKGEIGLYFKIMKKKSLVAPKVKNLKSGDILVDKRSQRILKGSN